MRLQVGPTKISVFRLVFDTQKPVLNSSGLGIERIRYSRDSGVGRRVELWCGTKTRMANLMLLRRHAICRNKSTNTIVKSSVRDHQQSRCEEPAGDGSLDPGNDNSYDTQG